MTVHPLKSGFFLLILTTSLNCQNSETWARSLNNLLRNCSPKVGNANNQRPFLDVIRTCLQRRALIALDSVLSDDIIPVANGIELVRFKQGNINSTDGQFNNKENNDPRESGKTWREIVFTRFGRIFKTHVLRIDVDRLMNPRNEPEESTDFSNENIVEGRRRRHRRRHNIMPMMTMGLLIMGSVLIPMGFQFLAVLGGKALILAKLALMLSSIQGLKKIATSGVNYGLYHSPVAEGWHERSHQESVGPYEVQYQPYSRP